jgi:hypothetical protein
MSEADVLYKVYLKHTDIILGVASPTEVEGYSCGKGIRT